MKNKSGRLIIPGEPIQDLTENLARANKIIKKIPVLEDSVAVLSHNELKKFFEAAIMKALVSRKLFDLKFFLCGTYIAKLLSTSTKQVPESFYASDFLQKSLHEDNPYYLQEGANLCFLFTSVFKERCNWRGMSQKSYADIGSSLFFMFYGETEMKIGLYMGEEFELMSQITTECINSLN